MQLGFRVLQTASMPLAPAPRPVSAPILGVPSAAVETAVAAPSFGAPTADPSARSLPPLGPNNAAYASTLWSRLVADVAAYKASDITFTCGGIFLKIAGQVERYLPSIVLDPENGISNSLYTGMLDKLLEGDPKLQKQRADAPLKALDFASVLQTSSGRMRFRVNMATDKAGRFAVLRPLADVIPSPEALGLSPELMRMIENMTDGLLLVVGTTNSGKSTTIASILDYLARIRRHVIVTIEDPIEIEFENRDSIYIQREVGTHCKNFQEGLRDGMRESPNTIFVGEIRDIETAKTALEAAETGHLVIATMHAKRAAGTVSRIVEMAPHEATKEIRGLLARVLRCVIAQVLLPSNRGGRVAIREIMFNNNATAASIREGNDTEIDNIMMQNRKAGMISFQQHLTQMQGSIVPEYFEKYHEPNR